MRFGFIIAVILAQLSLSGQINEVILNPFRFTYSDNIESYKGHLYLTVSKTRFFSSGLEQSFLYKLNEQDLKVKDSIQLNGLIGKGRSKHTIFAGQLHVIDSFLVVVSSYLDTGYNSNCPMYHCGLSFFDDQLNLVDEILITDNFHPLLMISFHFNEDWIVLGGAIRYCDSSAYQRPAVALVNRNSEKIKWVDVSTNIGHSTVTSIALHPAVFGDQVYANLYRHAAPDFESNLILDTNLRIKDIGTILEPNSGPLGNTLYSHGRFLKVNGDIFQVGLSRSYFDSTITIDNQFGYWNLAYTVLDSQANVGRIDTLPLSGYDISTSGANFIDVPFNFDGMDPDSRDSVAIIVNTKFVGANNFRDRDTVPFYIYNLNLNSKTVNWSRKVTRSLINSNHAIASLPNNRYAISFNQYDWVSNPNPNLETVVWILDSSGNIINEREFENTPKWSLYPNPSEGVFNLSKSWNHPKPYKVLDLQGRVQFEGILDPHSQQINLQDTSPDHYILLMDGQNIPLIKK